MKKIDSIKRRSPEQLLGTPGREYYSHSGSFTAAKRDRARSGPMPFSGAADAHLDENTHSRLRAFCQDIDRNSDLASAMIDRHADALVGEFGFGIQAQTDDEEWNKEAEELFWDWAESPTLEGDRDLVDVLHSVVRDIDTDGDLGFIWTNRNLLQPIESERICSPGSNGFGGVGVVTLPNGGRITRGIETNAAGMRVAYHVAEYDTFGKLDRNNMRRIPAESFFFVANPWWRKSNQKRGIPHIARTVRPLAWLTEYNEATTLAAIVGCNMMAAVKTENPEATRNAMAETTAENADEDAEDRVYGDNDLTTMSPLTIAHLKPGESWEAIKPSHPTTTYESFSTMLTRFAGNALGLPLSVALSDSSKTNYYGQKAERGLMKRSMAPGTRLLTRFIRWIWRMFIGSKIDANELAMVDRWNKPRIVAPPMAIIDEAQEVAGAVAAINANLTTERDQTQKLYGRDSDDVKLERSAEVKKNVQLGIVPMAAPGSKPAFGGTDPNQAGNGKTNPGNDPNKPGDEGGDEDGEEKPVRREEEKE